MSLLQKSLVLVVELEPMARSGLVHCIEEDVGLQVCGATGVAAEARELCARWRPALVVMDCLAPGGLSLLKELPRWSAGVRVVCYTRAEDALSVQRVLQAGARGYVTRMDSREVLLETLRAVLAGQRHLAPRVEHAFLDTLACGGVEVRQTELAALSDRELEVFRLLGEGLGTRGVAERLGLSVKTVETHRERMKEKLHVASGQELLRRAALFLGAERGESAGRG